MGFGNRTAYSVFVDVFYFSYGAALQNKQSSVSNYNSSLLNRRRPDITSVSLMSPYESTEDCQTVRLETSLRTKFMSHAIFSHLL